MTETAPNYQGICAALRNAIDQGTPTEALQQSLLYQCVSSALAESLPETPLERLLLPTMTRNALRRAGHHTIEAVARLDDTRLQTVRCIGTQGLQHIRRALQQWYATER